MTRTRALSPQALNVLAILAEAGADWRHGYELANQAGIKSGTLYPLLIRLESLGYLEAQWQEAPVPGRPPRHVYRLTAEGVRFVEQIATGDNPKPVRVRPAAP